jgi:hypothetical protein
MHMRFLRCSPIITGLNSMGRFQALPANIRLGWMSRLIVTNTLAYYNTELTKLVKRFTAQAMKEMND